MAEWLSSWLAEQEVRGSIPRLATLISEIGYLLLPSRDMAESSLKRRKSSIQPTNKPSLFIYEELVLGVLFLPQTLHLPEFMCKMHVKGLFTHFIFAKLLSSNIWKIIYSQIKDGSQYSEKCIKNCYILLFCFISIIYWRSWYYYKR